MPDATEELHPAQIAKLDAEAAMFSAEAAMSTSRLAQIAAETRKFEAEASLSEGYLAKQAQDQKATDAGDRQHSRMIFNASVDDDTAIYAITKITEYSRLNPGKPIEIILNSPGGSITDGFALIDFIRLIREQGTEINITALGMAASMGGVILQAASTRRIGKHSVLLLHEGSMMAGGSIGSVEDRVAFVKGVLHPKILALFADRSAAAALANPSVVTEPLTADEIKDRWARKDWWLPAEDALKHGFVDQIV